MLWFALVCSFISLHSSKLLCLTCVADPVIFALVHLLPFSGAFYHWTWQNHTILKFLSYKQLLRNDMLCNHCGLWMSHITDNSKIDGYFWRCKSCKRTKGLRQSSFWKLEIKTFCSSNGPVSIFEWCKWKPSFINASPRMPSKFDLWLVQFVQRLYV